MAVFRLSHLFSEPTHLVVQAAFACPLLSASGVPSQSESVFLRLLFSRRRGQNKSLVDLRVYPVGQNMRHFSKRAQFPRIHGEEVSSLRRAATISKHGDAAISGLEGDTFESHFNFVMVYLNVLHFCTESVHQGCI